MMQVRLPMENTMLDVYVYLRCLCFVSIPTYIWIYQMRTTEQRHNSPLSNNQNVWTHASLHINGSSFWTVISRPSNFSIIY